MIDISLRSGIMVLLADWERQRDILMVYKADHPQKAEMSRIAAAYEDCVNGLRRAIGELPL